MRVSCEVPEVQWGELIDGWGRTGRDGRGTNIPSSRGWPRTNPLLWKDSMASSTVHFKAFIRAYRGIRASSRGMLVSVKIEGKVMSLSPTRSVVTRQRQFDVGLGTSSNFHALPFATQACLMS